MCTPNPKVSLSCALWSVACAGGTTPRLAEASDAECHRLQGQEVEATRGTTVVMEQRVGCASQRWEGEPRVWVVSDMLFTYLLFNPIYLLILG